RMPWANRVKGNKRRPKKNDFFILGCLIALKRSTMGKCYSLHKKKVGPNIGPDSNNNPSTWADLGIDDLFLMVDRLLVDGLEELQYKFLAQSPSFPFQDPVPQDGVPAVALQHGHVPLFFQGPDPIGHLHAFSQKVYQLVVKDIDLCP